MLNINLFGGPSCGKSSQAAGLFYYMKLEGYNVEYIQEYVKDLVYSKDITSLSDQLLVISQQRHRVFRLEDKVDFLVHDSPFLLGLAYKRPEPHVNTKKLDDMVIDMFKSYDNFNFFLERNINFSFQDTGRVHNLQESISKDNEIKNMLDSNKIPYISLKVNKECVKNMLAILERRNILK